MHSLFKILGVGIIIFISIYTKFVSKIPSNIYYVLFVLAAVMILVGNYNKR